MTDYEVLELVKRFNAAVREKEAAEITKLERRISALEQLRPVWAKGYSSDGEAAQITSSALSQLWEMLGVSNQTDAVKKLKSLLAQLEANDDPELDGTDGAHPAYWRGEDYAIKAVCNKLNAILDGKSVTGVCNEPLQSLRVRLAEYREKVRKETLEEVINSHLCFSDKEFKWLRNSIIAMADKKRKGRMK